MFAEDLPTTTTTRMTPPPVLVPAREAPRAEAKEALPPRVEAKEVRRVEVRAAAKEDRRAAVAAAAATARLGGPLLLEKGNAVKT